MSTMYGDFPKGRRLMDKSWNGNNNNWLLGISIRLSRFLSHRYSFMRTLPCASCCVAWLYHHSLQKPFFIISLPQSRGSLRNFFSLELPKENGKLFLKRRKSFHLLCFLLVPFYNQTSQDSVCSNKRAMYLGLDSSEIKRSLQRPPFHLRKCNLSHQCSGSMKCPFCGRLIKLCGLDYDEGQRFGLVLGPSGVRIYSCPTGEIKSLCCIFSPDNILKKHLRSLPHTRAQRHVDLHQKRPHMEKQLQCRSLPDYVYNNSPSFPKAIYFQPWSNRSLK